MVPNGGANGGWIEGLAIGLVALFFSATGCAENRQTYPKQQSYGGGIEAADSRPLQVSAQVTDVQREADATDTIAKFTVVLAIVAIVQGYLIFWQIIESHIEFIATHRPRIHVRRIYNVHYALNLPPGADIEVSNVGNSKAIIRDVGVDIFARRLGDEGTLLFNAEPRPAKIRIDPGQTAVIPVSGGKVIPPSDVLLINTARADLCILATINYEDARKLRRVTSIFRTYVRSKRRFFRVPDDDEFAEWEFED